MTSPQARLEYLRGEIQAERISYGELAELQDLVEWIDPGDVELLEWAGVPEHDEMAERLENTIGVCVTMRWDAATKTYVPDGPMTTTTGGLFSDAEEGPWDPDESEWVGNETNEMLAAHAAAEDLVTRALRQAFEVR